MNPRRPDPTPTISGRYGAPLGRPNRTDRRDMPAGPKFSLVRIRLNSGGYDSGGAYWGVGKPLYYAAASRDDTGALIADRYLRAASREIARATICAEFPDARFYR